MLASGVPYKFLTPWAADATTGFLTNPIPATATGGAASQQLGFPPITATAIGAGGIPPNVNDTNGVLYYLTAWAQWVQAGAPVGYDATFSSSITGYPKGAVLLAASGTHDWLSTTDNNTTNPDTGGAGWIIPNVTSFNTRAGVVSLLGSDVYTAVGTLGGVLSGTLPNPVFARNLLNVQTFSAVGGFTYTPTAGAAVYLVEIQGGCGGSGGLQATSSSEYAISSGANAGAYAIYFGTAVTQTGAVGAGGSAGGPGANGTAGGDSSFGAVTAHGGAGSVAGAATSLAVSVSTPSTIMATATGGNVINLPGSIGTYSTGIATVGPYAAGGPGGMAQRGQAGNGAAVASTTSGTNGNSGTAGIVIVYEYQ